MPTKTERGLNTLKNLWTDEQIEQLKQLAGTMSSKDIGAIVGRSRDAVKNKIEGMGLPRFGAIGKPKTPRHRVRGQKAESQPVKVEPARTEPMLSLYKNHEAAARAARRVKGESPSRLEWCKVCHSPVSNWQEHEERQGHGRRA